MKNTFRYFTLATMACMAVACHKDSALTTLPAVTFSAPLSASPNTVALSATTDASLATTFKWPAVVYPVKAQVTYTLQADVPADVIGASPWANAQSIPVGKDILTKTFNGADLNALALNLGLAANATGTLVFRILAYQDRPVYSNGVQVAVTTYVKPFTAGYPVLYVPGDYQGWSPPTAPTVAASIANVYEGYINEPAGGSYHFKFTSANDWNHINYGAGNTAGTLSTDGQAGDLVLPSAGYYELVANPAKLTWSYTKITWAIIGDATPNGWGGDTPMAYDAANGVWTVTCAMLSTGSFKFRANNAWNIDFGIDANNHLQYADNPAFPYNGNLNNLSVPSSGNYTIILNLRDPNNYTYKIQKN